MTARETTRERWVRRTRESTLRYLAQEQIPLSARAIEGNLDIGGWGTLGPIGARTDREIGAALRWLVQQGHVERLKESEREPSDPLGPLYVVTYAGLREAARTSKEN